MTPVTLFNRIVLSNARLHARYKNPQILPLGARSVLLGIFKLIADSPERGVFRPDPDLDGPDPLPVLIARSMDAVGAEHEIGQQLALLARLGFLAITNTNCILVQIGRAGSGEGGGARVKANRANGAQGGRPREGETAEEARLRRRALQGSLMLPLDGGGGPAPYGDPVVGDVLAHQLRSQMRIAGDPEPETQVTQFETQAETQVRSNLGFNFGSEVLPPQAVVVEVEDKETQGNRIQTDHHYHRARAYPRRVKPNRKPKPKTQTHRFRNPNRPNRPGRSLPSLRRRSHWSAGPPPGGTGREQTLPAAQRVFQDRLQEGWTVEQIEQAIDGPAQARSAGIYTKVLIAMFGGPGRGQRLEPASPRDTRNYPPDLGGDWAEPIAKIRERLRKADPVEYRSWLEDARLTRFDDGELEIWAPRSFHATHLRSRLEDQILRVIRVHAPHVSRLSFTSPASMAKTG